MNILIVSSRFGLGHQMVAKAIGEQIKEKNRDVQIFDVDLFAWFYPKSHGVVVKGFHVLVEYCSLVYNAVYRIWGRIGGGVKKIRKGQYNKMEALMQRYQPDVVICTIPVWGKVVAGYLEKCGSKVPLITCVTDVSWHPAWLASRDGVYLVPTQEVKDGLVKWGVNEESVFFMGVPVRKDFWSKASAAGGADQCVREKEGGVKEILIMGGGFGIIPRQGGLIRYLHGIPGVHVTIATGNNQRLYQKWKGRFEDVEVLGYTERIWDYMKRADLVISKAGGSTLFELMACEVPIFVIHPFLQQEVENARFIEQMGIGKVAWKGQERFILLLGKVIGDEMEWRRMRRRMQGIKEEGFKNII